MAQRGFRAGGEDDDIRAELRQAARIAHAANGEPILEFGLRRAQGIDGGLADPEQADVWLTMLPGVVTSGIFADLATEALLGRPDGQLETLVRATR